MKLFQWLWEIIFGKDPEPFIPPYVPPVIPPTPPPPPLITPGEKLFNMAVSCLGKDASPKDVASDEFGCAESVTDIIHAAFGDFPEDGITIISTITLAQRLRAHSKFEPVTKWQPGDIIISPTGSGNGSMKNGHTGIVGVGDRIMSNDSRTGLFNYNYSINSWIKRFRGDGGFPIYFYRRVKP